jgi:isopentenyl-diphosphate delta-isomerase
MYRPAADRLHLSQQDGHGRPVRVDEQDVTIDDFDEHRTGRDGGGIEAPRPRRVVLVDVEGRVLGEADKLDAHQPPGQLHLAFSVFLYRSDGRLLLQQRAAGKYHFPLVWGNACCSHPEPGAAIVDSARRRLREELGLDAALAPAGTFVYRAVCEQSGLVEHELDHVLVGVTEDEPQPEPAEVADVGWFSPDEVLDPRCGLHRAPWLVPALLTAERFRASRAG